MPRPTRKTQDKSSDAGESQSLKAERQKVAQGARALKKDVKNEGRSDYVYENKDTDDNFPDTKDEHFYTIARHFTRNTRILQKPSALLSIFERWRTNPSLRKVIFVPFTYRFSP